MTASYTLSPQDQGTQLEMTQGDYQAVVQGTKRYEDTMAQGAVGQRYLKQSKN